MYLRYNRYQMWPDKHSTGPKQLRRLLAQEKRDVLAADRFPHTSVAVQGFTTLERLLYPTRLQLCDFGMAGSPSYPCELMLAIARNIDRMSTGLLKDWRSGEVAYRDLVLGAEHGNDYFESSKEVSSRLLNNLHTQLQSIVDQKLLRPMKLFKLRRSESWRSRRSLRNILMNLRATEELYNLGFAPAMADKALDTKVRAGFKAAIDSVKAIDVPLYEIEMDSDNHRKLERVLENSRALKRLVATKLPQALDLTLGFNSLDGD
jgi:predicted lipoprotein